MTYRKLIKTLQKKAKENKREEEAIRLLILELSKMNGTEFLIHLDDELTKEQEEYYVTEANKYIMDNIPIQHIIGYTYFFGYKFKVSKDVLIPRFETEELVANVLSYYDDMFNGKKVDVVDVGTGSGAIAIALAKEESNMTLTATDISPEALVVAKENAFNNEANVTFLEGDMLQPLIDKGLKFDILVSNPPYITTTEYVQDIVLDNEPHVALFGGVDGLKFYDIILSNASKVLKEGPTMLAFEHSYSKGKEMLELAHKYFPNGESFILKDMNGKDRMMFILNK